MSSLDLLHQLRKCFNNLATIGKRCENLLHKKLWRLWKAYQKPSNAEKPAAPQSDSIATTPPVASVPAQDQQPQPPQDLRTASLEACYKGFQVCLECRAIVPKRDSYIKHVKTFHPNNREQLTTMRCEECRLQFRFGHQYAHHYIVKHDKRTETEILSLAGRPAPSTGDKGGATTAPDGTCICEHCFLDCKTPYGYKKHQQTHILDLHSCKICEYVTKNKFAAVSHLKRAHAKEFEENMDNVDALIQKVEDSDDESDLETSLAAAPPADPQPQAQQAATDASAGAPTITEAIAV